MLGNKLFTSLCAGFLAFNLQACSPVARQGSTTVPGASPQAARSSISKLIVFGGEDHKTYLGCLNCSEYASDSIRNTYGPNGSPYSQTSIWNHYADFGSPYAQYSACNPYTSDPPVIVDPDGNYYGRLTVNQYHPQLGVGSGYYTWLKETVCK